LISIVVGTGLAVLLLLALSPLLLWGLGSEAAGFLGTSLAAILLLPWCLIMALSIIASSMLRQVSWRACSQEGLGVVASIRRGFTVTRGRFKEVFITWLVWAGSRVAWLILAVILTVLLAPLILVGIVVGALLGMVPALITLGIASFYLQGVTPWVLAGLAALPFFIIVAFSPVIFIGGLVRIFLSNLWTLTCLELPSLAEAQTEPAPSTEPTPTMHVAPAS